MIASECSIPITECFHGFTKVFCQRFELCVVYSKCSTMCVPTASNILIKKRCGCSEGVFTCSCREEAKCQVKLSDFDSVQRFQSKEFLGWHQDWWPYVPLTPEECGRVMGTPGYRAPEVCDILILHTLLDGHT